MRARRRYTEGETSLEWLSAKEHNQQCTHKGSDGRNALSKQGAASRERLTRYLRREKVHGAPARNTVGEM